MVVAEAGHAEADGHGVGVAIVPGAQEAPGSGGALLHDPGPGEGSLLDLSMDLVRVIELADCEQALYRRVILHEKNLTNEARLEVGEAVSRHEQWLTNQATADVQQSRLEAQMVLHEHDARAQ